ATLEVITVGVRRNALNYHLEGKAYGFDVSELKVETPGPLLNTSLEIAIPQTGAEYYTESVAALPERKVMWESLRSPARKLKIRVQQKQLERYLEAKGDKSRILPSIDALAVRSVEVVR